MRYGLALRERALHNVREVRNDTQDMCLAKLVQALRFRR